MLWVADMLKSPIPRSIPSNSGNIADIIIKSSFVCAISEKASNTVITPNTQIAATNAARSD